MIAVAAHEGCIYLYALHSMDHMRTEFDEKSSFKPVKEVRILSTRSIDITLD